MRHTAAWHVHLICRIIAREALRSNRLPVQARDLLGVSPRGCTAVARPTLGQNYSHRHAAHTRRITLSIHTYVRARARGCADVSLPEHASARPCGHRGTSPRKAAAVQPVRCINAAPEISRLAGPSGTDSAGMPAHPGATLCIRQRSAARCGMPCLQRMWPSHRRYTKSRRSAQTPRRPVCGYCLPGRALSPPSGWPPAPTCAWHGWRACSPTAPTPVSRPATSSAPARA